MLNITRSLKYIIKKYNKILYLNIYMLVIIGSLLISTKCSAALNDIVYFDSDNQFLEYFSKNIYDEQDDELNPDLGYRYNVKYYGYKNTTRTSDKFSCCKNKYNENVLIKNIVLNYSDRKREAYAIIAFETNIINYRTNDCKIYINGELEDSVKLYNVNNRMIGYLRIDIFSRCINYKVEVATVGKDGEKLRTAVEVELYYPLVTTKQLINKIENTQDNKGLNIEWKDLGKVESYYVFRSKQKDGIYELIGKKNWPLFTDNDVKKGKTYYYHIFANFVNGEELQSDDVEGMLRQVDNVKTNKTKLNKPKIRIKKKSRNWQIYWGIISDKSTCIEIYMKNGRGKYKNFRKINITTNLKKRKNKKGAVGITSSRKSLVKGVKYQFKARTFY